MTRNAFERGKKLPDSGPVKPVRFVDNERVDSADCVVRRNDPASHGRVSRPFEQSPLLIVNGPNQVCRLAQQRAINGAHPRQATP